MNTACEYRLYSFILLFTDIKDYSNIVFNLCNLYQRSAGYINRGLSVKKSGKANIIFMVLALPDFKDKNKIKKGNRRKKIYSAKSQSVKKWSAALCRFFTKIFLFNTRKGMAHVIVG